VKVARIERTVLKGMTAMDGGWQGIEVGCYGELVVIESSEESKVVEGVGIVES
jgi:hypothetical protein